MNYLNCLSFFLFSLLCQVACHSNKTIEIKNEQGIVIMRISNMGDTTNGKNGYYEKFTQAGLPIDACHYINGKVNGERKQYEEGKLYSTENLINDVYEGEYKAYYPSGKMKASGQYQNNVTVGVWKGYYPSGLIKEEVTMADNEENGPFIEYYENGQVKVKGNYYKGINEHGELLMYDSTGILIKKMDCNEGICKTIWEKN